MIGGLGVDLSIFWVNLSFTDTRHTHTHVYKTLQPLSQMDPRDQEAVAKSGGGVRERPQGTLRPPTFPGPPGHVGGLRLPWEHQGRQDAGARAVRSSRR